MKKEPLYDGSSAGSGEKTFNRETEQSGVQVSFRGKYTLRFCSEDLKILNILLIKDL